MYNIINILLFRFNIESLVDYLLATGDFSDPETRLSFSDSDLKEIDSIVSTRHFYSLEYIYIVMINLITGYKSWFK